MVLINAVLLSLPIYYLSFYSAPKKVINKIIQMQIRFIWGGSEECRKICWVKLEDLLLQHDGLIFRRVSKKV